MRPNFRLNCKAIKDLHSMKSATYVQISKPHPDQTNFQDYYSKKHFIYDAAMLARVN